MKQKIILLITFIALSFAASAQYSRSVITTSDATAVNEVVDEVNQQAIQELEAKELKKQQLKDTYNYWKHIVMLNANFSLSSPSAFTYGATYAYVKQAGFYVSFETNFGPIATEHPNPDYLLTGKGTVSKYSAKAGGMVALGIPLYLQAGIGYSYCAGLLKTTDGDWLLKGYDTHNVAFECGLLAHYKNVAFSLMYSMDAGTGLNDWGFKVGVGYCF